MEAPLGGGSGELTGHESAPRQIAAATHITSLVNKQPTLIVMVKAPRAGQVKTRLCPPLAPEQAASLAACFARDTVTKALSAAPRVLIAYAPEDGRGDLEALLPGALSWTPQKGETLPGALSDSGHLVCRDMREHIASIIQARKPFRQAIGDRVAADRKFRADRFAP